MKQEETIDFHIKRTWQSIAKMYNEVAAGYGATMATGYILLHLDMKQGTPSTSLGPKMGVENTSLSRILKSMEDKDLIIRKPNPDDGRGVLVYLTEFGKEKRQDARQAVFDFNTAIFEKIPADKLQTFFEVIEEVNFMITNRKIEFNTEKTDI